MAKQQRIGIIGAGATGGYLAGRLAESGVPVVLVARGASNEVISKDGITLQDHDGETRTVRIPEVVAPGEDVEPVDLVFFCVKAYDTEGAASALSTLLSPTGRVVCLQNGVKNEPVLASVVGEERVQSGVMYIGSERVAPGKIACSTPPRIIIGPYRNDDIEASEAACRVVQEASIECKVDPDITAAKWQKFLFNCGLNPLTTVTQLRMRALLDLPETAAIFHALVDEAYESALAAGAPLSPAARQGVNETAERMDISSSMAEDLVAGRSLELDAFSGYVIELGQKHGVETPTTRVIHGVLCGLDERGGPA